MGDGGRLVRKRLFAIMLRPEDDAKVARMRDQLADMAAANPDAHFTVEKW
jgi:hypothetical protein